MLRAPEFVPRYLVYQKNILVISVHHEFVPIEPKRIASMYGGRSDSSNFMDILRTGTRTWRLVAGFAKLGNDIKNELYTPPMPTKHTHTPKQTGKLGFGGYSMRTWTNRLH